MTVASSPNKIHLSGEHGVVYGSLALLAPVEVDGERNKVTLETRKSEGGGSFEFKGDLGRVEVKVGEVKGDEIYRPLASEYLFLLQKLPSLADQGLSALLEYSHAPKGTGNSASIAAALACAVYASQGVKPTAQQLFEAAFVADNEYHAGKSSGGDVAAVLGNKPILFKKTFGEPPMWFKEVDAVLPHETSLILIQTSDSGKTGTGKQIEAFAQAHGIKKTPNELTPEEREEITKPFNEIVEKIVGEMHKDGDARRLGELFNENHALLESVTAPSIEKAREVAHNAGAYGSKLVGAGGNGGAVIALLEKTRVQKAVKELKEHGLKAWKIRLAKKGTISE